MALDIGLNDRLKQFAPAVKQGAFQNRSINDLLNLVGANKAVPQKAAIVNFNNSGYAIPQSTATAPNIAPVIQPPQYIANAFTPQGLAGQFLNASNSTADLFTDYEKAINPYLQDYNKNSFALGNDILGQLNSQKANYLSQYGPQGTLQKQLEDYYGGAGAYLASQQAGQQALQSNEALRATGSNAAAGLAGQKVADDFLGKSNELAKQRLGEQSNIYQQLNQYLNQFTQQYANTKDKYVLDTYKRLFDFKNQLAGQILQQQNALVSAQLTKNTTPVRGTGTGTIAKTVAPVVTKKVTQADEIVNRINGTGKNTGINALDLIQNMRKSGYSAPVYTTNKNAQGASKTPVNIKVNGKTTVGYKVG